MPQLHDAWDVPSPFCFRKRIIRSRHKLWKLHSFILPVLSQEEHKQQPKYNPPPDSKEISTSLAPQLSAATEFPFLELPSLISEHKPRKGQAVLQGSIPAPQDSQREKSQQCPGTASQGIAKWRRRSGLRKATRSPSGSILAHSAWAAAGRVSLWIPGPERWFSSFIPENPHNRQAVVQALCFQALENPGLPPTQSHLAPYLGVCELPEISLNLPTAWRSLQEPP